MRRFGARAAALAALIPIQDPLVKDPAATDAASAPATRPASQLSAAERLRRDVVLACEGRITIRPQAAKKAAAAGDAVVPVMRDYAGEKGRNALSPSLVEALGGVRGAEARQLLLELTGDRSFFWRPQAVRALGEHGAPEDTALIRDLLADPSGVARAAAAEALARRGDREAVPLLAKSLADEDHRVRLKAAGALATLGDDRGLPVLVEILKMDQEFFGDPFGLRARGIAFQELRRVAGEDFGYSPGGDDEARARAVEKFEAWARERLRGDYALDERARHVHDGRSYVCGLELRTCNLGEAWLRLDASGEVAFGLERPVRVKVPAAAAEAIRRAAAAVPAAGRRVFGTVVCDFERMCGVGADGKGTVMAAPGTRPPELAGLVRAFVDALRAGRREDLATAAQERALVFGAL